jgi:hypothetical protein
MPQMSLRFGANWVRLSQIFYRKAALKPVAQKKLPGTRPGKSNREVKEMSVKASSPS